MSMSDSFSLSDGIAYRESCPGIVLAWAVAICVGGNVVAGIYAIIALLKSKGNAQVFFMGENKIKQNESADC